MYKMYRSPQSKIYQIRTLVKYVCFCPPNYKQRCKVLVSEKCLWSLQRYFILHYN